MDNFYRKNTYICSVLCYTTSGKCFYCQKVRGKECKRDVVVDCLAIETSFENPLHCKGFCGVRGYFDQLLTNNLYFLFI